MYCANCGAQLREGANFCSSCGTKVEASVAVMERDYIPESVLAETYTEPEIYTEPEVIIPAQPPKKGRGPGIASLIFGIFALCIPVVGVVLGIVAVICAGIGMKRKGKGMAIAGLTMGLIGIIVGILILAFGFMFHGINTGINKYSSDFGDFYYEYGMPDDWNDYDYFMDGFYYDDWDFNL